MRASDVRRQFGQTATQSYRTRSRVISATGPIVQRDGRLQFFRPILPSIVPKRLKAIEIRHAALANSRRDQPRQEPARMRKKPGIRAAKTNGQRCRQKARGCCHSEKEISPGMWLAKAR